MFKHKKYRESIKEFWTNKIGNTYTFSINRYEDHLAQRDVASTMKSIKQLEVENKNEYPTQVALLVRAYEPYSGLYSKHKHMQYPDKKSWYPGWVHCGNASHKDSRLKAFQKLIKGKKMDKVAEIIKDLNKKAISEAKKLIACAKKQRRLGVSDREKEVQKVKKERAEEKKLREERKEYLMDMFNSGKILSFWSDIAIKKIVASARNIPGYWKELPGSDKSKAEMVACAVDELVRDCFRPLKRDKLMDKCVWDITDGVTRSNKAIGNLLDESKSSSNYAQKLIDVHPWIKNISEAAKIAIKEAVKIAVTQGRSVAKEKAKKLGKKWCVKSMRETLKKGYKAQKKVMTAAKYYKKSEDAYNYLANETDFIACAETSGCVSTDAINLLVKMDSYKDPEAWLDYGMDKMFESLGKAVDETPGRASALKVASYTQMEAKLYMLIANVCESVRDEFLGKYIWSVTLNGFRVKTGGLVKEIRHYLLE